MHSRIADIFRSAPPPITSATSTKSFRKPRAKASQRTPKKMKEETPKSVLQENPMKLTLTKKKRKQHIPLALREQVWIKHMGKVFHGKCNTTWCQNTITVFDFQSGHDIPESKGGPTTLENLIPLCSRCNNSMGNGYTFKEWCALSPEQAKSVPLVSKKTNRWWCF